MNSVRAVTYDRVVSIEMYEAVGEAYWPGYFKAIHAALKPGGRLAVISFHSLEDRMIKRFMRDQSRGEQFPPGMAVTEDMLNRRVKIIGKAIKPSAAEIEMNKRSRSAVMRIAEKIG